MKEYMIHIWGGAWNDNANPSIKKDLGIDEGYHYFKTKEERDDFSNKLKPYEHLGLVRDFKEGELTHKRTVAIVGFYYGGKEYNIEKDFGYEYEEERARFMFYDGNYSCDCNRSLFINDKYEYFPELGCGQMIHMTSFKIEYRE